MALTPIPSIELQYVFTCPNPPTPYYIGTGANELLRTATFDFTPLLGLGSIGKIRYLTFNYSVSPHDTSGFAGVDLRIVAPLGGVLQLWPWSVGTGLTHSGSPDYYYTFTNFDLPTDFSDQTVPVTAIETAPGNVPSVKETLPEYSRDCYFATMPGHPLDIVLYSDCQGFQADILKVTFSVVCDFSSQWEGSSFPLSLYPKFVNQTTPPVVIVKNLVAWCEAFDTPCRDDTTPPPPVPPRDKRKGRGVSHDVSDARRHARSFIDSPAEETPGAVVVGLASNVLPFDWDSRTTTITANAACIRWDRQSTGSPLYLLIEVGGQVSLYKSTDEGRSWTMATVVGSGVHPALLIARDGRRFCYWVSDATIVGKVYDPVGNVWKDTFVAVADGVSDDKISADEFTISQARWGVSLLYRATDGTITTATSTDGVIFT